MDRRENIILNDAFTDTDCILKIISVPRHVGDQHILPDGQFSVVGAGAIRNRFTLLDLVSNGNRCLLVNTSASIGPVILAQPVHPAPFLRPVFYLAPALGKFARLGDHYFVRSHGCHHPVRLGLDQCVRIPCHLGLHPRGDERRLGGQQRNGLALHVRPHQGPVGIIMLQEWYQAGCHGHQLLGRHVHVIDLVRRPVDKVRPKAAGHLFGGELAIAVDRLVCLGNEVLLLNVAGQVIDFVSHSALHHLAVRTLDKTKIVHPGKRGQAGNQSNVGTFRRLHRTNTAVVGGVYIPDLKPGAFAGQTARTKCREATLMCQLCQRVDLIHELG